MSELITVNPAVAITRPLDAERLVSRWKEGRSAATLRAYNSDLIHFATWFARFVGRGAQAVAEAVATFLRQHAGEANETARAYRSAMVEQGLAPSTINRRLAALRSLVALARELGFIQFELSTQNVRAESYRDTRGPDLDNVVSLIGNAQAHRHATKATRDVALLLLLGYGRALRRGEVVSLDLEHFDAGCRRLSVLRKGKRERQWLSLDPMVTAKLQAWIALRGSEPGPLFVQIEKGGRIQNGRRLSGDGVHKLLQTMGAKIGVIVRPHGLRHAAITAVLEESNGNVRAAREFSGHASLEVLLRYDDNRRDIGGEVSSKVLRRLAAVLV